MPGNIFRNLVLKFDIDIFKIIAEIAFCTKKFFCEKKCIDDVIFEGP